MSTITVADLVTAIKKINAAEPENLVLLKYAYMLLDMVQKDASGRTSVVEASASTISSNGYLNLYQASHAYFGGASTSTAAGLQMRKKLNVITITSNAGGSLDTDVDMVAALSGYYGVCKITGIHSDGAETPTFEIQGNASIETFTTPAFTAGQVESFLNGAIIKGDANNQAIFFDTTCANLGNVKTYKFYIEYWYET